MKNWQKFLILNFSFLIALSGCASSVTRREIVNPDGSRVIETRSVVVVDWLPTAGGVAPKPRRFDVAAPGEGLDHETHEKDERHERGGRTDACSLVHSPL